jgi:hypothetical protein
MHNQTFPTVLAMLSNRERMMRRGSGTGRI